MKFSGKVVAITGAEGGIGRALCSYFAAEGAAIAAVDKRPDVERLVDDLERQGARAVHAIADVGDRDAVAQAFDQIGHKLGLIDILVNNAGFSEHPTFARTDPAGWQYDVNGNLNGAYYCAHAVLPGHAEKEAGVAALLPSDR